MTRPRVDTEWRWRHGAVALTANGALWLSLLTAVAVLARVWWLWVLLAAVTVTAVVVIAALGSSKYLTGGATVVRGLIPAAGGAWATWAVIAGTRAADVARTAVPADPSWAGTVWLALGGGPGARLAALEAVASGPWSPLRLLCLAVGAPCLGVIAAVFASRERAAQVVAAASEAEARGEDPPGEAGIQARWGRMLAQHVGGRGTWDVIASEMWPQGTGYTLEVRCPAGVTEREIARNVDALAGAADLPAGCGVEVRRGVSRGVALLDVSTVDTLAATVPYPADYSPMTINNPLPMGVRRRFAALAVSLRYASMLLVGQVGSGKSNTLHVLIAQLTRCVDTVVWCIDTAGGGAWRPWVTPWVEGRADRPALDWVASSNEDAALMLRYAVASIHYRKGGYEQLKRQHDEDKLPVSPEVPQIVIVVDEAAELPNYVLGMLESVSNLGRGAGVRLVTCALGSTSEYVPPAILKEAQVRMSMRTDRVEQLAYLFTWAGGVPDPRDAPHEGCAWHADETEAGGRASAAKVWRLAPGQLNEVAVAVADRRPAMDALTDGQVWAVDRAAAEAYRERWSAATLTRLGLDTARRRPVTVGSGNEGDAGGGNGHEASRASASPGASDPTEALRRSTEAMAASSERIRAEMARLDAEDIASGTVPPDAGDRIADEAARFLAEQGGATPAGLSPAPPPAQPTTAQPGPEDRMMQLLADAGQRGSTPGELESWLKAEGYSTARSTIDTWLKVRASRPDGDVTKAPGPRSPYVHRKHAR